MGNKKLIQATSKTKTNSGKVRAIRKPWPYSNAHQPSQQYYWQYFVGDRGF